MRWRLSRAVLPRRRASDKQRVRLLEDLSAKRPLSKHGDHAARHGRRHRDELYEKRPSCATRPAQAARARRRGARGGRKLFGVNTLKAGERAV